MKKYFVLLIVLVTLIVSCTITPEEVERRELSASLSYLGTPDITVISDNVKGEIKVKWNEIENATHYIVEYQSATDYLSGKEMKRYSVPSQGGEECSFTLNEFQNKDDKRTVFKVKAVHQDKYSKLESNYSELKEGAIVDDFSMTLMIKDSKLSFYDSYAKVNSIIGNKSIIDCFVKYYEGDFIDSDIPQDTPELISGTRAVNSAETITITAALYCDGKVIKKHKATIDSDVSYTPRKIENLKGSMGVDGVINLSWTCPALNAGLENTEIFFTIERKESSSDSWEYLLYEDGTRYFPSKDKNIKETFDMSYEDKSASPSKDYIYRVITCYKIIQNENEFWSNEDISNNNLTDICYVADTQVKSFELTGSTSTVKNSDGNYETSFSFHWDTFHPLPEEYKVKIKRTLFDEAVGYEEDHFNKVFENISDKNFTDTIILSPEEKRETKSFTYSITLINNEKEYKEYYATAPNGQGQANITIEGDELVAIITPNSFSVTTEENALNNKIVLSWNHESSFPEDFDKSKVTYEIFRLEEKESSLSLEMNKIADGIPFEKTTYIDDNLESGVSYNYRVRAVYTTETTSDDYKYSRSYPYTSPLNGSTLPFVQNLKVSRSTYVDRLVATWNGVSSADSYHITCKVEGKTVAEFSTKSLSSEDFTKEKIDGVDSSSCIIKNIDPKYYGSEIEVTVKVVDRNEVIANEGISATGKILSSITPKIENKAKEIVVTWNQVEGATKYTVNVYSDENGQNKIDSKMYSPSSNRTYILSIDSDAVIRKETEDVEGANEYPLSKSYYFSVIPSISNIDSPIENIVEGMWITPPKNIQATKAEYSNDIIISWDAVDLTKYGEEVHGYNVYYKEPSAKEWTPLRFCPNSGESIIETPPIKNLDKIYDFTVSTVTKSRDEGPKQDTFNGNDNRGYVILKPGSVDISTEIINKEEFVVFRFDIVPNAAYYSLTLDNKKLEITEMMLSAPSNKKEDYGFFFDGTQVTAYIKRNEIIDTIVMQASICTVSDNAANASKNTSLPVSDEIYASYLANYEIANLALSAISSLYSDANSHFDGDWFYLRRNVKTYSNGDTTIKTSSTPTNLDIFTQENGESNIDNYYYGLNKISGTFSNHANSRSSCAEKNELEYIDGNITLTLPGVWDDFEIGFKEYKVDGSSSTSSISVNGEALPDEAPVTVKRII